MNKAALLAEIMAKLEPGRSARWPDHKGEYWSLCPFHKDQEPNSFSFSERGYKCFACNESGSLWRLAEHLGIQSTACTAQSEAGLTLQAYSEAKKLPLSFLESLGVRQIYYLGRPALLIPYYDENGEEIAARIRLALDGKDRFRWRKCSRAVLYELAHLSEALKAGYVILVEGESDTQTLWFNALPALGLPGATTWKHEWAKYVHGLRTYIWQEPDPGGEAFVASIVRSLPEALILVPPEGLKDISQHHTNGGDVPALIRKLVAAARPAGELLRVRKQREQTQLLQQAGELPYLDDILAAYAGLGWRMGLAGEERNFKLVILALVSRLLEKPVNICVKGPSAAGKTFLVETALRTFPPEAYYILSGMSERVLAYSEEPLKHRFLILYEAAALTSEFATYLLRTLLSEGRLRYEMVEKTRDGLRPRLIEREGPTGFITTTTRVNLHPENETRMFSITMRDDPAQTRDAIRAAAARASGRDNESVDVEPWHALQKSLQMGERRVIVPYASWLAERADVSAVRMRRDFPAFLYLVRAHALLHQARRERDSQGQIIATIADYRAVYGLVVDIISEGVKMAVSTNIRQTVAVVRQLLDERCQPVTVAKVARKLGLDESAAWRRVREAVSKGFLVNEEGRRGLPAELQLGDPLPEERLILPSPQLLEMAIQQGEEGCSCPTKPTASLQPPEATHLTAGDLGLHGCSDDGVEQPPPPLQDPRLPQPDMGRDLERGYEVICPPDHTGGGEL